EAGARVYGFPNRAAQPDHDDDGYPGRPPDGAGIVVDGQVLDETADTGTGGTDGQPAQRPGERSRPGAVIAVRQAGASAVRGSGRAVTSAYTGARKLVTHRHTKRGGKLVGRNFWYPIAGGLVLVKRWRDAHGAGRYERMMRQAELVGNFEMLGDWEARDVSEKQRRHDRVMDWVRSPAQLIKAIGWGLAGFAALLLGLGIVLAIVDKDSSWVLAPIMGVFSAIRFVVWFLSVYGVGLISLATASGLWFLWHTGRNCSEPPQWMAPPDTTVREVIPDEGAILAALRNLNLPALNRKFKEGWTPRWPLATGRDGKGYRTQLELPAGVTVEMINRFKPVLAHNLVRLPVEVWPTEPRDKPGVLDLWVADQGILTDPVEPYPLLTEGECDYFTGVPAGVDQRGDLVTGKFMGHNYAVAGTMGSGKTSLIIELLCGAMLDPLVDIEVYVMAYNVDYDPMAPRLSVLVKGDEDEQILAAIGALRSLREEVTLRGKLLAELGGEETKLTRAVAAKDARMRPKVVVFDECQELFRHEKYGEQAKELAIKVMMKARKCGITLLFVTPAPSADSLPRDLAKTVSHRVCFAIGDHQGNDAILGTGAHRRGITAVDLVPGEDVGTAMASGFATRPGLLRTHHIRKDKTADQLTPIVERACGLWTGLKRAGTGAEGPVGRDLLDDVWTALRGEDRVKATDVAARLREIAPDWPAYVGLTAEGLAEVLDEVGVPVRRVKGTLTVRSGNVLAALGERAENLESDSDEEHPDGGDEQPGVNRPA
ncbi:MAG TPA: zonular occludens toxin domain-containing protein, partial [Pseudonocardia sp.]